MKLSTDAIVLRDYKIEEDRILTLLTRRYGLITAYANGANRMRSRLAGSTELLCYSDFILFKNREKYSVDGADLIRSFFGLRSDIEALALASYFSELVAALATHSEDAESYLKLVLNTLHFLENGERDRRQLKSLFELRILTLSGYMPDLIGCRECASYTDNDMYFFFQHGDLLCGNCMKNSDPTGTVLMPAGVLAAMRHIIYCAPDKLFSFSLSDSGLKMLSRVTEQYLKYQLERTFNTLEFYHSLAL